MLLNLLLPNIIHRQPERRHKRHTQRTDPRLRRRRPAKGSVGNHQHARDARQAERDGGVARDAVVRAETFPNKGGELADGEEGGWEDGGEV